jgi:hypothetical protein
MHMADPEGSLESQISLIGCCGAYCGTCRAFLDKSCKGCKLGYDDGKRDIRAARCAMKRCCLMVKKVSTCADCPDYAGCRVIQGFFEKNGYKYKKYRQSLEFIRESGYPTFIRAAQSWKCAYGSLKHPE